MSKTAPSHAERFSDLLGKIAHHVEVCGTEPSELALGPRNYLVLPGVYNPKDSPSTSIMLEGVWRLPRNSTLLDVGCGIGVLGLEAAYRGARKATLCDVNAAAVKNAKANIRFHTLQSVASAHRSNLFAQLGRQRFDVVLFNMPFVYAETAEEMKRMEDVTGSARLARSYSDPGYRVIEGFFRGLRGHLNRSGFAQVSFANLGNGDLLRALLKKYSLRKTVLVRRVINNTTLYVYRVRPRD